MCRSCSVKPKWFRTKSWTGLTLSKPHGGVNRSVILLDVPERFVEQVLIFDPVFHVDHLAKFFADLTFSSYRVLPAWEANDPDDLIDLGDDPVHNHGCV